MPIFESGDGTPGGPESAKGSMDGEKYNLLKMKCDYIIYTCQLFHYTITEMWGPLMHRKIEDPISDQLSFILPICNMKRTGEVQQKNRIKRA